MGQFSSTHAGDSSGIKVLDRAVKVLEVIAHKPRSLADLCETTGLPRATAHRLATALETHRMLTRTRTGQWAIGPLFSELAVGSKDRLITAAEPLMEELLDATGESVQVYQLTGTTRTCVAAIEPATGLHHTVPVGSRLELTAGSAAQVFLAYGPAELRERLLPSSAFSEADLEQVRKDRWSQSHGEREPGLASMSAPIFDASGALLGALSISGSLSRFTPDVTPQWATLLRDAAEKLSAAVH